MTPKATWGKIKHWDQLSYYHRELLKKEICPFYKECTKPVYINDSAPELMNQNVGNVPSEYLTFVNNRGFYAYH